MSRRRALAFGLSFFVYLLPIVGPHAGWLLGEVLVQGWSSSAGARPMTWRAADLGVAVALQALAFVILLWALKRPIRLAVFVGVIPVMEAVALVMYLSVIPSHFLIEEDTAPELDTLTSHCDVPHASLMPVRRPADLPALPVEEWWVMFPDGRHGLMRAADCQVTIAAWPQPTVQSGGRAEFVLGVHYFVPGGGTIVEKLETATAARTWWLAERADTPLRPIRAPASQQTPPVLSNDGLAVVWTEIIPGSGPPVLTRLVVQSMADDHPDVVIDLTSLGPASYTVAAFDARSRTLALWQNERMLEVGFDGKVTASRAPPDPVRPQPGTFLIGPAGSWLTWDAYQERDPYRMSWSTTSGQRTHVLPKGRSFTDAALEPSRGLVALSASTTLSIGDTPDLVAILDATDGRDVFRRYLPRFSRSPTIFFAGGLFGYSDTAGTHVVRLAR